MLKLSCPKAWLEAHYGIALHAGVQICTWTKKALRKKGVCYKQRFYGIECHRCAQITPLLAWCDQNCIFCWRPSEWMEFEEIKKEDVEKPDKLIPLLVKERKRLISGLGGAEDVDKKLFDESYNYFPSHWAISLSGEPTLYPYLPELIKLLKEHPEVKSVFLVTNGQHPKMIERLKKEDALPTQLYVSLAAWDENSYKVINKPKHENGWQKLMKTMSLLSSLDCRTVIRLTLIKDVNTSEKAISSFANIIANASPDFVEVKSYICIGKSREKLSLANMLSFNEVSEYADKLLNLLSDYRIIDADPKSRIVLLGKKTPRYDRWIIKP